MQRKSRFCHISLPFDQSSASSSPPLSCYSRLLRHETSLLLMTNNHFKMEIESRVFEYKDVDGTVMEGFLALPKNRASQMPGVLIFHAFAGCVEFEMERAKDLAKLGFAALAADVYGKGKRGKSFEENYALMMPMINDRNVLLKKRMIAACKALQEVDGVNGEKIGAIGYCFGGLCALDLARHKIGLKTAISFHGTLTPLPDAVLDHFDTSIQVHNGDADIHIKKEVIEAFHQEMRDRDVDWAFYTYGKAAHGFTNPASDKHKKPGLGYNKEADIRSWAAAIALLKEKLF